MSGAVFDLRKVFAGYNGKAVIKGISAGIPTGGFVSIIGPNGSGKSTLLKSMAGDLPLLGGEIYFMDRPLVRNRALAMKRSVVHQSLEQVPPFLVRDFLLLGRFPYQGLFGFTTKADRDSVDRIIEMTGVFPLIHRRLNELSGGELQLVRIAHSLVQNSGVILLDEPVSHLDMKHTVMIMDLLHRLYQRGSTVVVVLHDVNIASEFSTAIMGIKGGEIFFYDEPSRVIVYDRLEALFDTKCVTLTNPISGRPFTYPVPEHVLRKE